jgi:hypothetical protein
MKIMEIGLTALQNIGTNYSIRVSDKELLVYEEDKSRKVGKSDSQKLQEESKQKKQPQTAEELSQDEKRLVNELQARDSEVRAHEAAHQSGGASTGGASYTYQQGPDGKMYAIGGEVSVSMRSGSTPQETIRNAQAVIAAAMAPSDPSGQDLAVASSARVMIMKAQQQKAKELQEELSGKDTYKNEANQNTNKETNKLSKIDIDA